MLRKVVVNAIVAIAMLGCSRTITTNVHTVVSVFRMPEVALVSRVVTLSATTAADFKRTHAEADRCVYQNAVHILYWQDDLKLDRLLLLPSGSGAYDAFKIQVVNERVVREVSGERNGKPFHYTKIEDVK